MALLDLPLAHPTTLFARLASRLASHLGRPRPQRGEAAEEARARRAFIQEMLDRNPQAFGSAEDLHGMMGHFPDRF